MRRAAGFFAEHGVAVQRVMTDNPKNYVLARAFQDALIETGARHVRIAHYRPHTNGKAERFNRTLLEERPTVRPYSGN